MLGGASFSLQRGGNAPADVADSRELAPQMSGLGQERTSWRKAPMSAYHLKADIREHDCPVRFSQRSGGMFAIRTFDGALFVWSEPAMLLDPERGFCLCFKFAKEARHTIRPGHLDTPAISAFDRLQLRHDERPP